MFTSQLIAQGTRKQMDIIRAFAVPAISVKRAVKLFRAKGAAGFFRKKQQVKQDVDEYLSKERRN